MTGMVSRWIVIMSLTSIWGTTILLELFQLQSARSFFLRSLSLYNNKLDGTIPTEISLMTTLNDLNLGNNLLDNPIPDSMGSLSVLYNLDLGANRFLGDFPSIHTKHDQLAELKV